MIEIDANLYTQEYPRLIETLRRIIAGIQSSEEADVSSLILFGSVARLTPHIYSDTDMLVLFAHATNWAEFDVPLRATLHIIRTAEEETVDERYRWRILPIPADAQASDLDPDFLKEVGREGVLLYQRDGFIRPDSLKSLEPFSQWETRVRRLLATLAPAT
jgi:predicted nucleotidyltransferase